MNDADIKYLIRRLERIKELVDSGDNHMAAAKLLADIAALSGLMEAREAYSAARNR